MDGPFGVVLWGSVVSSVWYGGRVYSRARGSSGSATREGVGGAGRLPWYSGHYSAPRGSCGRRCEWTDGPRAGGCRFRRTLRCSIGTFCRSARDRDGEVVLG